MFEPFAEHPFRVLDYEGEPVEIDVEIVPLIEAIWALGLETLNSCQDFDGDVWLELPGRDAAELVDVVAGQDRELRSHVLGRVPIEVSNQDEFEAYRAAHGWKFRVLPLADEHGIWMAVQLRFPRDQLEAVVVALNAACSQTVAADGAAVTAEGTTDD